MLWAPEECGDRLIVYITYNAFHSVKFKGVNGLALTKNRKLNRNNERNRHFYFSGAISLNFLLDDDSYVILYCIPCKDYRISKVMRRGSNRAKFKFEKPVSILTSSCRHKGKQRKTPKYYWACRLKLDTFMCRKEVFPFQVTSLVWIPYYLPIFI